MTTKPVALFDIDKTMFDGFSYFPLMGAQITEGLLDPSVETLAGEIIHRYDDASLTYEDFVRGLVEVYANGLESKPASEVQESTDSFFGESDGFFGYVQPTVGLLAATNELVIVTGGTQFAASAVAKVFGFPGSLSSHIEVHDGIITGNVSSTLASKEDKKAAIKHLEEGHPFVGSFAFGDSESDIAMLESVETPICIQPSTVLREAARLNNWAIVDTPEELASKRGLDVVRALLTIS